MEELILMETLRISLENVGGIYSQDVAIKYLANLSIGKTNKLTLEV